MATVLTVTANTLVDHLAAVALRPGAVARAARFTAVAGGKGLNVGRVLARHGHRVLAAGFAGGRSGDELIALARADGLEPAFTLTAARTRIGFQCREAAAGTASTAVIEDGFAVTPAEAAALVTQVAALLPGASLCIISGSVPDPATCAGLYRDLAASCHRAGVSCWIDAYGPAMDACLAGDHPPALAKPNREEYAGDPTRWRRVGELHLSDGAAALRVRHPTGNLRVTPPRVAQVNPIGSGDSYLAALACARLRGDALPDQLRYAAAAGAANARVWEVAQVGPADIAPLVDATVVAPDPEPWP
jgi:fructose-1-phosphate kinase PfkB-like protein